MTALHLDTQIHSFHIPVMGTAFTIDTPIKVGKYGIHSVVSIGDNLLCEQMREKHSNAYHKHFTPITEQEHDFQAKRITAYLNLLQDILDDQMKALKGSGFETGSELHAYFELLADKHPLRATYNDMMAMSAGPDKETVQADLIQAVRPGDIEVNILTKVDKMNYDESGNLLPDEYSDALSAFRGFANSKLKASIILSAGFNRRLYAYVENFSDFYPNEAGVLNKKIILKVSDFRSTQIQGRFFAKKGVWISEYRIESGLNCGGHAFATEGLLLGPILESFKENKDSLAQDLFGICQISLEKKSQGSYKQQPPFRVTVQGGIGTANEQSFLLDYYGVDGTGWATPFLLVPEVTTLDPETRKLLSKAGEKDLYLSGISPLGVPFNTVRGTDSEKQRLARLDTGKPGSPCPKGYLVSNTEFSKKPVCTASIFYQRRKLKQIESQENLSESAKLEAVEAVGLKTCLCEDLAASSMINHDIPSKWSKKTAVCPGPNLAYFSGIYKLKDMVDHIYGKVNLLSEKYRPHFFVKEMGMYVEYLEKEIKDFIKLPTDRQRKYCEGFKQNLLSGMAYYKNLFPNLKEDNSCQKVATLKDLEAMKAKVEEIVERYSPEVFAVT